MNIGRRPLPWWVLLTAPVLIAIPVLTQLYFHVEVPFFYSLVAYGIFYVLIIDSIVAPGRKRLEREVFPAGVFAAEYDGGTRAVLGALSGARLEDSWSFLVTASDGVEVWTLERQPMRVGVVRWSSLRDAQISSAIGRWGTGTVEVALADGRALHLDVTVRLLDRIRHLGSNASELVWSLNEYLNPAQPDAAHTRPPARTE